ncbi:RHOMBOID-like protein 1 isoform X2 [Cucumis melo var. makuwa]|uniref:RHOMBOID-like protein n=1 Tax=Cucumis melo var. makuwa TaxID=1194695 RepID=A0A5A7TLL8_CUCMM|nr:RHOMBOID-like protein 1 isoform X2 [Cucumis melo var. makuwa]
MVLGTGERHLQDDAKEAIDIASRAHKSRPQVSLEKVRKVSITDSSNTIHCSIVTSMGETCSSHRLILNLRRASMAEHHPSDIQINSRQGTAIHPVEADGQSLQASGSVAYWEVKQFRKWIPWLIPSFVIANIVMFIITMSVNNCPKNSVSCIARFLGRFSFQSLKENPLLGPSSLTLRRMGALEVNKVVHGNQLWRLVTCIWLHAGVFHLLANMLSLLVIGIRLEQEFGFLRIGLLYVISGFGGSLLSSLFIQSNISVGASGALFGLLGGMLSELITNWTIYSNKVAALVTLLVIIVINLAVGILPHVDNFAHIGGFISGFLLGFIVGCGSLVPRSLIDSKSSPLVWFYFVEDLMQTVIVLGAIICLAFLLQNGAVIQNLHTVW